MDPGQGTLPNLWITDQETLNKTEIQYRNFNYYSHNFTKKRWLIGYVGSYINQLFN